MANQPIVAGMSGNKTAHQVSYDDTPFEFDSDEIGHQVFVLTRPQTGPLVVHDDRCSRAPKESHNIVPVEDIGMSITQNGKVQVCCTYCVRKGWLWDWTKNHD